MVKPAAPAVMATGLYAGTTLADDGSPILLFDPAGLAQVGGVRLETLERGGRGVEAPVAANSNEVPVLLFRGLDGARRALRLGVVDRIEEVEPARRSGTAPASFGSSWARRSCRWRASTSRTSWKARSASSASTTAAMRSATPSAK